MSLSAKTPKNHSLEESLNNLLPSRYEECYVHLSSNRIVFLTESITKTIASSLTALLINYDKESDDDIIIYISSNGGDSSALVNIYDVMQTIKSPITTVCIGKAYSAAAFILAAGTQGKRSITKNANVMIHGLQCVFPANPLSDQRDAEIYYNFLDNYNKNILSILAKHTKKPLTKIIEDCKRDYFMDAKEALKYGIVDKII